MEDIMQTIFTQEGLLSSLFVGLLLWVLKKNDEREIRYITTIDNITRDVKEEIEDIKTDVGVIKDVIKGGEKSGQYKN